MTVVPRIPTFAALLLAVVSAFGVASVGCARRAPNATPEGAVREFVERMSLVTGQPAFAKSAFELLSTRAQENLAARAQRYGAASGKAIAPEAMLAPSRFRLRFEAQRYEAKISGIHALVEARGLLAHEKTEIPCVYEQDGWRVDLALPALPPVQMRPGAGG